MPSTRAKVTGFLFALIAPLAPISSARAGSADELVRMARAREAAQDDAIAVRRYTEALQIDPSFGEAYLGLGALRMRTGDMREAERVYAVALEHVPSLRRALQGRARARWAVGRREEAMQDMEIYAQLESDVAAMRELAGWLGEEGRTPAQLAIWRRVLAMPLTDVALAREARRMVRALQILVGQADPAASPFEPDLVRRTLAAIAKRGG